MNGFLLDTNIVSELVKEKPDDGLTVVTRNAKHFPFCEVVNPWSIPSANKWQRVDFNSLQFAKISG